MIWLTIPYMTWLSRMGGGGPPRLLWGLDQWLLGVPYLIFYPQIGYWAILGYLGAVLGLRLGHGRFFNYGLPFKAGSEPEKVEVLIPQSLPIKWQKILGMTYTGLAVTLLVSILLLAQGQWMPSMLLGISGAAKCLAYFLPETQYAEYARGAFLGLGVSLAFMVLS